MLLKKANEIWDDFTTGKKVEKKKSQSNLTTNTNTRAEKNLSQKDFCKSNSSHQSLRKVNEEAKIQKQPVEASIDKREVIMIADNSSEDESKQSPRTLGFPQSQI